MKLLLRALRALVAAALVTAAIPANAAPPAPDVQPSPGKALLVLHTRVDAAKAIPEGRLHFQPYDRATGRLAVNGIDTNGHRFTAGRWIGLISNKSMRNWKGWAIEVEPGSYVLAFAENPNLAKMGDSMFPFTWAFDVAPDTVIYVGDFTQKWTRLAKGWGLEIVPESDEPRARAFLADKPWIRAPFVAAPLRPVTLSRNPDRSWAVRESQ